LIRNPDLHFKSGIRKGPIAIETEDETHRWEIPTFGSVDIILFLDLSTEGEFREDIYFAVLNLDGIIGSDSL